MTSLLFFLVRDFHQGLELLEELPLFAMVRTLGDHARPAWGRAWAKTSPPPLGGLKTVHSSPPRILPRWQAAWWESRSALHREENKT